MPRSTQEVYGNQSFRRLRDNGCFVVYNIHITMLKDHKEWLINNPVSYDIFTRMGYVDYNALKRVDEDIELFEALKKQARDN